MMDRGKPNSRSWSGRAYSTGNGKNEFRRRYPPARPKVEAEVNNPASPPEASALGPGPPAGEAARPAAYNLTFPICNRFPVKVMQAIAYLQLRTVTLYHQRNWTNRVIMHSNRRFFRDLRYADTNDTHV